MPISIGSSPKTIFLATKTYYAPAFEQLESLRLCSNLGSSTTTCSTLVVSALSGRSGFTASREFIVSCSSLRSVDTINVLLKTRQRYVILFNLWFDGLQFD